MPQLIALGLIGGVVWYGWRALKKEMVKVKEDLRAKEKKQGGAKPLKQGKDGVYRVEED